MDRCPRDSTPLHRPALGSTSEYSPRPSKGPQNFAVLPDLRRSLNRRKSNASLLQATGHYRPSLDEIEMPPAWLRGCGRFKTSDDVGSASPRRVVLLDDDLPCLGPRADSLLDLSHRLCESQRHPSMRFLSRHGHGPAQPTCSELPTAKICCSNSRTVRSICSCQPCEVRSALRQILRADCPRSSS